MEIPTRCPVCQAYSISPDLEVSSLLAVCNVLVFKALEKLGQYITRQSRPRFKELAHRPFHVAHTIWPTDDQTVTKALRGAWDVIPALLDVHGVDGKVTAEQVTRMLDSYTHDLAITGTPHTLEELRYRFTSRLGLPV